MDNDVGNNSLVLYHILSIRYIKLQSNESEDIGNVFIIGVCIAFSSHQQFRIFKIAEVYKK